MHSSTENTEQHRPEQLLCPHCQSALLPMELPPDAGYDAGFFHVCFNDECPYFVKGWDWMWTQYQVKTSYRHRIDPMTGNAGPLPVWSPEALKNRIISE